MGQPNHTHPPEPLWTRARGAAGFSLLEVMVSFAILSGVIFLTLGMVTMTPEEANAAVCEKEMADLQAAFQRLDADLVLSDAQLDACGAYGLWGLVQATHPVGGTDLPSWDRERQQGWRGPYAAAEGVAAIDPATPGQPDGGVEVPVFLDPYGNRYRVLIPDAGDKQHLAVVSTGSDGQLQTSEAAVDGEIVAAGDDTVRRLLPLAP